MPDAHTNDRQRLNLNTDVGPTPASTPTLDRDDDRFQIRVTPSGAEVEWDHEPRQVPLTEPSAKLRFLLKIKMTSFEIAAATGCSIRAVEDRRRKLKKDSNTNVMRATKLDIGLDDLYILVSMMNRRYQIEPENIRAWLLGRSEYLEEQRPVSLLRAGEFELVRAAAIAYATSETPPEFLSSRGTIRRVDDAMAV